MGSFLRRANAHVMANDSRKIKSATPFLRADLIFKLPLHEMQINVDLSSYAYIDNLQVKAASCVGIHTPFPSVCFCRVPRSARYSLGML